MKSPVLVCLLPGLGDALVATPIVRGLRTAGVEFDILAMLNPVAEYARSLGYARRVISAPLLDLSPAAIAETLKLRRERYQAMFIPFPAARWQYAAVAAAIGSRNTWVHRYGGASSAIASLSGMHQIPLEGGHRFSENQRLAQAAGLPKCEATYEVPRIWRSDGTIPNLLGVHTGTMRYKGNEQRRWPLEKFAAVVQIELRKERRVRAFIGPNEHEDRDFLMRTCPGVEIVQRPLAEAARSISECEVFLGNDSGLVHVAGGLGVKVVAIFGMTDPVRAQPLGHSEPARPSACPPCFDEGARTFNCVLNIDYRCIKLDVTVDFISTRIDRAFDIGIPLFQPLERGPYRLYGELLSPSS
jgi:ADP-heptose:LPS heptosyltransferase